MTNKINTKKRGFTLVETLVAISVLSMAVLGTFTAVQSSLQKSIYAKNQITAFYLVQEIMEYVRNVRDENAIKGIGTDWLHGLSEVSGDPCYFGKICKFDMTATNIVTECGTNGVGTCPVLKQDPSTSLFNYTSGENTKFTREVMFDNITVGKEIMVTVTISWDGKSLQVKQLFTNNRL